MFQLFTVKMTEIKLNRRTMLETESCLDGDVMPAHHEDTEHHVVVVDEEDELVSSGGKLSRHL